MKPGNEGDQSRIKQQIESQTEYQELLIIHNVQTAHNGRLRLFIIYQDLGICRSFTSID